ncbi:MAG: PAS domain S-box protein [Oculatellaceae cyanobacterium bins.114]|nr:PAS domain S-box protein [Oculatellaceae cyanobacterium bins.114]
MGFLWVFYSDWGLSILLDRPLDTLTQAQTIKGWFYVIVTSGLLYWLVNREIRANKRSTTQLQTTLAELMTTREALQESEERFRVFMDNSPTSAWITDLDGRMEYVNQTYQRMFQVPADLLGQSVFDLYPREIAEVYVDNLRIVVEHGQVLEAIEPGVRFDGTPGEFLVYKFLLPGRDGCLSIGGVALDITEQQAVLRDRLQSETIIRESERRFRGLVENASDIITILDRAGNFCYASPSAEIILGYSNADVLGKSALEFVHPEDAGVIVQTIQSALLQPGISLPVVEYRVRHRNGDWRTFEAVTRNLLDDPAIAGIVVNCRDISDRKLAEAALQASETRYRQIVETQTDFVLRSTANTTITFANTTLCRALGKSLKQLIGTSWSAFVSPEEVDVLYHKIAALSPNQPTFENINSDYRSDGQIGWTQWINLGIFDAQGNLIEIQSVGRDVTAQKQLEQALRQQAERLELTSAIAQRIRQTLHLKEILNTTVSEIKQWLQTDRVVVYQFAPDMSGTVVAEAVTAGWQTALNAEIQDTCFQTTTGTAYIQGRRQAIDNIYTAGLTECHLQLLEQFEVKANLVVPIVLMGEECQANLWGLLVAHQCSAPRKWQVEQLDLLDQIAVQLAIAIQQAQAFEQAQTELAERQQVETQLRSALTEKEVLLKEIHHRVKNNLQIVSGLLQLQAQGLSDTKTVNALRESQSRIESMSLIHKKLYTSSDLGQIDVADYIQNLAVSLLTTYQISPGSIALNVDVESVILNLDQAIPCGLIINELVSNALKHAFLIDQPGEINIKLCQVDEHLKLTIQDNGVGLPEQINWQETQSLGLSLVYALATEQLDGELVVDHSGGMTFIIQFPNLYHDS